MIGFCSPMFVSPKDDFVSPSNHFNIKMILELGEVDGSGENRQTNISIEV